MERLFSGIQPTGEIHIGNYLGAVRNWVALQASHESLICIVDYHAVTIPYDVSRMRARVLDLATILLASGIDPERTILFVQSSVPEHLELAWIFNTLTPMGDLQRMTQFKEKSAQHDASLLGLFAYPVLQAADILLYHATVVPVGEDQLQHLELSREIARKFNARFGATFAEPKAFVQKGARIRGLDGKAKMSKSQGNTLPLICSPEEQWNLLRGAVTDENRKRRTDPGDPDKCNIDTLHGFFTEGEEHERLRHGCRTAGVGCVDCKRVLSDRMTQGLAPIRERYAELLRDPEGVERTLRAGAERARAIAVRTMEDVRAKMGLFR